jgi:hypothetical protein
VRKRSRSSLVLMDETTEQVTSVDASRLILVSGS